MAPRPLNLDPLTEPSYVDTRVNFGTQRCYAVLTVATYGEVILESEFNKILLDLEIKGLISVSWQTKNIKRIEYVTVNSTDDEYDKQIKETEDRDYEASFPNTD